MMRTLAFACLTLLCWCTLLLLWSWSSMDYQNLLRFRSECANGANPTRKGPTISQPGYDGGLTPLACIYVGEQTFMVPMGYRP